MQGETFCAVLGDGTIMESAFPAARKTCAIDFEATGRLVYAKGFRPRLFQVCFEGRLAIVLNAETHRELIIQVVREAETLIVHNGSYDLAVLDRCYGVTLEETWAKAADTQEMARLLFPTESEALKDLARKELSVDVDSDKELRAEFKRLKLTPIETGYAKIPLDNDIFVKYAGLDSIYTYRLWEMWRQRFV